LIEKFLVVGEHNSWLGENPFGYKTPELAAWDSLSDLK